MNTLWIRNTPILPASPYDERNENTTIDNAGCPSDIFFGTSAYTLSFGQLLSGNTYRHQSFNPICQSYPPCSYKQPDCYLNCMKQTCRMPTLQSPVNPMMNSKVNEAMKTIRQTAQKPCHHSIPSVPHCYNPITNQNHMTKAAGMLEQAANAMSMATNRQNQLR